MQIVGGCPQPPNSLQHHNNCTLAKTPRTLEQVSEAANAAGVSTKTGIVQVFRFSDKLMNEDYKLLELPSGVLDSFQNGER